MENQLPGEATHLEVSWISWDQVSRWIKIYVADLLRITFLLSIVYRYIMFPLPCEFGGASKRVEFSPIESSKIHRKETSSAQLTLPWEGFMSRRKNRGRRAGAKYLHVFFWYHKGTPCENQWLKTITKQNMWKWIFFSIETFMAS